MKFKDSVLLMTKYVSSVITEYYRLGNLWCSCVRLIILKAGKTKFNRLQSVGLLSLYYNMGGKRII